ILADTLVDRVLLDGDRAVGVATTAGELRGDAVVLTAGAYGSPGILLRSGVGPERELPVGEGLCDHVGVGFGFMGTELLQRETATRFAATVAARPARDPRSTPSRTWERQPGASSIQSPRVRSVESSTAAAGSTGSTGSTSPTPRSCRPSPGRTRTSRRSRWPSGWRRPSADLPPPDVAQAARRSGVE